MEDFTLLGKEQLPRQNGWTPHHNAKTNGRSVRPRPEPITITITIATATAPTTGHDRRRILRGRFVVLVKHHRCRRRVPSATVRRERGGGGPPSTSTSSTGSEVRVRACAGASAPTSTVTVTMAAAPTATMGATVTATVAVTVTMTMTVAVAVSVRTHIARRSRQQALLALAATVPHQAVQLIPAFSLVAGLVAAVRGVAVAVVVRVVVMVADGVEPLVEGVHDVDARDLWASRLSLSPCPCPSLPLRFAILTPTRCSLTLTRNCSPTAHSIRWDVD
ncbi:hypothetical protein FA15DRAFT_695361 [Coprinopsis marcescibilis]|uniref:Uncharacterized protein n=1 Tax=Coprinopsis marcescibilis TaxID=230819 RepID=A0A5C3KR70_COPMA|nr:hypothetical protein FA15DRAFT_695361 [Coprinopsis marcescibilis]